MRSTVESLPPEVRDSEAGTADPDDGSSAADGTVAVAGGPAHRVRLTVSVSADELETAIDAAFKKLAREVRIPGFRPGKAPRPVIERHLGAEEARRAARAQALEDALPQYYVDAVEEHAVEPIAPPDIEITGGESEGDLEFAAVVEVRPAVRLTGHDSLRVELPYRPVTDADVDAQIDALRDRYAGLEDSEHPLVDEAYATIDITGEVGGEAVPGLTASDFLYRVGSAMLVPELDEQLRGTTPGAILEFAVELPERFGELAGETATFRVVVKSAQTKVLPALDDAFVADASECETVDELRAQLRTRLDTVQRIQAQMALRDRVLEVAADLVPVEPPATLVVSETRRRIEDLAHRLSHQGASVEEYLAATGQEPGAFVAEVQDTAVRAVLADLALRAVVAQEEISVSDDELTAEIERVAERTGRKAAKVRRDLERGGAIEAVRSEIARGKALEFLVDHAVVVDEEGNPVDLTLPEAEPTAPDPETNDDTPPDEE
ncbi:MAG: trigger factor [Actinomycetota bacterium]